MAQDSQASFHKIVKYWPFYKAESAKFSVQLQTPCSGKLILSPAIDVIHISVLFVNSYLHVYVKLSP